MPLLDPTLDLVFKLLLTREPALLRDMLEGILARPIRAITLVDPNILGEQAGNKRVIFDIRAVLDDGSRIDLEMQRRIAPTLASRLVYYVARDYAAQLRRGDPYHLLTPTTGIVWLVEPLCPTLDRLHSIVELRERHTMTRWSDQLVIHLLQLAYRSPSGASGYTARVERWARFLAAEDEAQLDRLATEDPIMTLAKQTLEQISEDPWARRMAPKHEVDITFFEMDRAMELAASRAEGMASILLKQLGLRFGELPGPIRARVEAATPAQLDTWAERVLTAATLGEVFAP